MRKPYIVQLMYVKLLHSCDSCCICVHSGPVCCVFFSTFIFTNNNAFQTPFLSALKAPLIVCLFFWASQLLSQHFCIVYISILLWFFIGLLHLAVVPQLTQIVSSQIVSCGIFCEYYCEMPQKQSSCIKTKKAHFFILCSCSTKI